MITDLYGPGSAILIKFFVLFCGRLERQDPEGKADCATYSPEELGRFSSFGAACNNLLY
jgi:hypothetical protein